MSSSEDSGDLGDGPPTLPPRLFAADSYPSGARLNIYSKANLIGTLYSILENTEAMTTILQSQFGKLFSLPVARCSNSVKLIHALLSRQLITGKEHELWIVFGGKPIKFSLREFHIISGLRCSKMPTDEEIKRRTEGSEAYWNELFPPGSAVPTVKSVLEMLKDPELDEDKLLPLALLVLVDGIVMCSNKKLKISKETVGLLQDTDFFLSFPWGTKSFTNTFSRFSTGYTSNESLVARLKQTNSAFYGFPLPLQLMAFECIPSLTTKIPNPKDMSSFIDSPYGCSSTVTLLSEEDIAAVETEPQVP